MKKTLIIGASDNPERYAYKAAEKLLAYQHPIVLEGIRKGTIFGHEISVDRLQYQAIDTITLYVGPKNQAVWYDYILSLQPKRILFNPGTENPELVALAEAQGIQTEEACTLVLLGIGEY